MAQAWLRLADNYEADASAAQRAESVFAWSSRITLRARGRRHLNSLDRQQVEASRVFVAEAHEFSFQFFAGHGFS
jgi:hypothetical protein